LQAGWEFNNDKTRSFERLVRRLLNYPKRPAVLLINAFSYADGFPFRGAFWGGSVERDTPEFSLYYDLPAVSVKGCCYHLMQINASGFRVDNSVKDLPSDASIEDKQQFFYFDNVHPYGLTGHRYSHPHCRPHDLLGVTAHSGQGDGRLVGLLLAECLPGPSVSAME
jgi:hypothetical protein